jgi:hypothetical protein
MGAHAADAPGPYHSIQHFDLIVEKHDQRNRPAFVEICIDASLSWLDVACKDFLLLYGRWTSKA